MLKDMTVKSLFAALVLTVLLGLNAYANTFETMRLDWGGFQYRGIEEIRGFETALQEDKALKAGPVGIVGGDEHSGPMHTRITLRANKVTLVDFIKMITNVTKVGFTVPRDIIRTSTPVTIHVEDVPARMVLLKVLVKQDLSFKKLSEKRILIIRDPLAKKITVRVNNASLQTFLDAVGAATDTKFVIKEGTETGGSIMADIKKVKALKVVRKLLKSRGLKMHRKNDGRTFMVYDKH